MAGRSRIDRAEVSQIAEPDRQARAIYVKLTELFDQDCTHFVLFIDKRGVRREFWRLRRRDLRKPARLAGCALRAS